MEKLRKTDSSQSFASSAKLFAMEYFSQIHEGDEDREIWKQVVFKNMFKNSPELLVVDKKAIEDLKKKEGEG
jgi:hypothetical protein